MSDTSEFIKAEWEDIHHSRRQDWVFLALLAGNLVTLITKDKLNGDYTTILLITGLTINIFGFYIATAHYIIFKSKMQKISIAEENLDIKKAIPDFNFKFKYGIISVQQTIMVLYCFIFSLLSVWLFSHLNAGCNYSLGFCVIIGILIFLALSFICLYENAYILRLLVEKRDSDKSFLSYYYAETESIKECLNILEEKPLKLIVPDLFDYESEWNEHQWKYFNCDGNLDINVLLNKMDIFQLSIANENSKQDMHVHNSTLEIYISESLMSVYFFDAKMSTISKVGIIIIPPKTIHQVKLTGLTYVFQVNVKNAKVGKDKVVKNV